MIISAGDLSLDLRLSASSPNIMSTEAIPSNEQADDEPQFHSFFNDPTDNTVLRSNTGMLFRASSFRLSRAW